MQSLLWSFLDNDGEKSSRLFCTAVRTVYADLGARQRTTYGVSDNFLSLKVQRSL